MAALPPRLYAIVDADVCAAAGRTPFDVACAFLSAGAGWIQLRCKDLASGAFLDLANQTLEQSRAAGAILIINDRADIAAIAQADGLHVGQTDLAAGDARCYRAGADTRRSTPTPGHGKPGARTMSYLRRPCWHRPKDKVHRVGLAVVTRASHPRRRQWAAERRFGGITSTSRVVIDAGAASWRISDLWNADPRRVPCFPAHTPPIKPPKCRGHPIVPRLMEGSACHLRVRLEKISWSGMDSNLFQTKSIEQPSRSPKWR